MRGLWASAVGFAAAAVVLAWTISGGIAADRTVSPLPATDLPGFDYSVIKNTDAKACEAACIGDNLCHAYTFNQKAGWCFLKGDSGPQNAFPKAVSGLIRSTPSFDDIAKARTNEIPFPASDFIDSARGFTAGLPQSDPPPPNVPYAELVKAGDDAAAQDNAAAATVSYRQALAINHNDPALWLKFAKVTLDRADADMAANNTSSSYDFGVTATYAALNGLLLLEDDATDQRAEALADLGHALDLRQMYRESIATWRASVALVDDATREAALDKVVAEHGFNITSNSVDAEAATPRICAAFSAPLPTSGVDLSSYVVIDGGAQLAVETEDSQICLTGVEFGKRYKIKFRAGLPSADGEQLQKDVDLAMFVPDRAPFVGFANNAYVMPSSLGGGLPITSVNAKSADIEIYRIGDRSIATAVHNGLFQRTLDGYSAEDIANTSGEKTWEGTIDLSQAAPNTMVTTAVPVSDAVGKLQPGAYVITAKVSGVNSDYWNEVATQWFIVSDLGITTIEGDDGVHAFVRSLQSAQPVANTRIKLVAVNNEILGEAVTDANGEATFAPGLARGEGGRAPQLITAETDAGDYAFLDVTKPAFDLTDRGVEGRPSPGPLDLYATTERGVYRPNETVYLTALLRDVHAQAVANLPLTVEVERPDGVVAIRDVLKDQGAGGYFDAIPLVADAMRGSWTIRLYADPKAEALTSTTFLVEDFEPERLAFEVTAPDAPFATDTATDVDVAAKYLYGATAPDLSVEADAVIKPVTTLPGFAGYTFGRADDTAEPDRESLGVVGTTDESGNATAEITIPAAVETTRPLEAQVIFRLVDTNGRPVERSITRPVLASGDRIGLKPQFNDYDGLQQGSSAGFDIITVAPDGTQSAQAGLTWTLSKIDVNYQWYRDNGAWKWEAVTTTKQVANGTVDTRTDAPVSVTAPVDWGQYRLEVETTGDNPTSSSYEFYAGYYYGEASSDTPDTLKVALDKDAYRVGDTATLKLDPQFAGTALVMVMDDRIIDMKAVDVPAGGTTVSLPVTSDWGPGAYVTAVLYRPADATEKRMPARALGLAFADVEPGDMKLDVALDTPKEALPRQSFTAKVKLANVAAGDTAYVAVAAVDLGILNLTNFPIPNPDGWYFGQRQLGMEVRDLYGQLIDPTQGMAGALRSGGDEAASRLGSAPPTSVLVALHSGIVKVDADGTATVTFDMPDFNGTVRVMAVAWTAKAVGHSSADVVVHDPVVVTMSPPRFLRVDDTSRLLVEINNISGPAGTYKVALTPGDGITTDAKEQSIDLKVGDRTSLDLGLTGTALGDVPIKLLITEPNGDALVKELTLGVRAATGPTTVSELIPLEPGKSVTLDASRFAAMLPNSGALTLAVGPIARLDVPGILLALDRYPYGCAEQVSSRAMPLLYLNDVAKMIGLGTDDALDQRIKDAIANLLAKQTSAGAFGLWGPDSTTDLWLDSYVTEFLIRAKDKGYAVPDLAMSTALDNLANQVSYANDFDNGGEDVAYALYDLARAGRAVIGDLRYYLEARLDAFGSPLAKAQLGAALALYGDRGRSAEAFAAAVADLNVKEDRTVYRSDYGSQLRDTAAIVALAAEFKPSGIDLGALTAKLAGLRDLEKYTSTQEDAWTLIAASALAQTASDGTIKLDDEALTGAVYRRYDQEHFDAAPVVVTNTSNQKTEVKVTVNAIPAKAPKASSNGFTIEREYYLPDGTATTLDTVNQNDRFVVVLTVTPTTLGSGQYMVSDPLPAGFEIENPDLTQGSGVSDLSWLTVDTPTHVEARTEQYLAAFRYVSDTASFTTAYMVRAVSPGTFTAPGATVEDMYRPEFRANTDASTVEVGRTGP